MELEALSFPQVRTYALDTNGWIWTSDQMPIARAPALLYVPPDRFAFIPVTPPADEILLVDLPDGLRLDHAADDGVAGGGPGRGRRCRRGPPCSLPALARWRGDRPLSAMQADRGRGVGRRVEPRAIHAAAALGELGGEIVLAFADRACPAVDWAAEQGIDMAFIAGRVDVAVAEALVGAAPNSVVLAGYMRIVGPAVLGAFRGQFWNTRPGTAGRSDGCVFEIRPRNAPSTAGPTIRMYPARTTASGAAPARASATATSAPPGIMAVSIPCSAAQSPPGRPGRQRRGRSPRRAPRPPPPRRARRFDPPPDTPTANRFVTLEGISAPSGQRW